MSYVNPPWNIFRRDIWLAIDRLGSSRLLYFFFFFRFSSLCSFPFLIPFHNTSPISASSSRSNSYSIRSLSGSDLLPLFYCAAKLALIGSTSIAVMRKVVGATPMSVNDVNDALYVRFFFFSCSDKFFVPFFNFNDNFIDIILKISRRLYLSKNNKASLSNYSIILKNSSWLAVN